MTDKIKNQQRQFMIYNLFAFTLIFVLFAGIVYMQIENTLMSGVREDLTMARKAIGGTEDYVLRQLEFRDWYDATRTLRTETMEPLEGTQRPPGDLGGPHDGPGGGKSRPMGPNVTMRTQVLLRDAEGEVQNPEVLGRIYYEDYLDEVPFTPAALDSYQAFTLSDGSSFLSLTFSTTHEGETYYIQLMTAVDGEQALVDNFLRLLVVCVAVFVLLSITASYVLSRKTMAPVITAWRRQSEFVENASHELRTPLTVVQNKLEALLMSPDATVMDRADDLMVTLAETQRLTKLTADLMTLARADADETLLQPAPFDLDGLLAELCEPYREMAEADEKSMVLKLGLGRPLTADRGRIHELMVILLDNALKYTGQGDCIEVITREVDNRAVIEVRDTGIGMSEEARLRAFDRFYREDKARSREKGGSGLGLSIAKWIVDTHGGQIDIQPGENGGTAVVVKLK